MGKGRGEGIGGVKKVWHLLLGDIEQTPQHLGHAFLCGGAVARYGLLDGERRILGDGYVAAECGGHGHSLGASELEHRLHVLAVEGGLDGKLNKTRHPLENTRQTPIMAFEFVELYHTHHHNLGLFAVHAEHSIAHHIRAGINTHDDPLIFPYGFLHSSLLYLRGSMVSDTEQKTIPLLSKSLLNSDTRGLNDSATQRSISSIVENST